jgi:polar amino acid transport system substrate-binding protein
VGELHTNTDNLWVIADVVPLFSEVGERGRIEGIAADLVSDILDEMALDQTILSAPWARIAKEAMTKSNVLVFSVIRTDERENVFHWVTPVSRNLHGLYGIDKPYFPLFEDVPKTYRVGTLLEDYRYQIAIEHGFKVKAYDSWQALADALINNEIDTIFGSQGAIDLGCNPKQFKCETITLSSKYDISTAYLALSKKDTCVLALEKLKLAAAGVKMSDKFNEQLSSWSDMVSEEYGIAHHTKNGVVHLWKPN